jgi:hypothetical protein
MKRTPGKVFADGFNTSHMAALDTMDAAVAASQLPQNPPAQQTLTKEQSPRHIACPGESAEAPPIPLGTKRMHELSSAPLVPNKRGGLISCTFLCLFTPHLLSTQGAMPNPQS